MIIDGRDLEPGAVIRSDICVVGSGVAGIAFANEFLNSHTSVTIVESGGLEPNAKMQSLNAGENTGLPYYDLDKARARAFGGTSHLWHVKLGGERLGVRLLAMDEIDFEKRDWVQNSGWPFPKSELDPFYREAHVFCGIGPYAYTDLDWADLLPKDDLALHGPASPIETKIFQFAEKAFLYKDLRAGIEHSSNVKAYLNATVIQAEPNSNGSAIEYLDARTPEGKPLRFSATRFVLAMGGLETPRLMLLSNRVHPRGIGNAHDNVGRFFMEHPHLWSGYLVPANPKTLDELVLYKVHQAAGTSVMGKLGLRPDIQRRERLLNFVTSIHPGFRWLNVEGVQALKIFIQEVKRKRFSSNAVQQGSIAVKHWRSLVQHGFIRARAGIDAKYRHHRTAPNILVYNVMAEQVPNRESRVCLSQERDFFGQNRLALNWQLSNQDIDSIRRSQQLIGQELAKAGFPKLVMELSDDSVPAKIHGGWHHMGTTRMDTDPKKGVVDAKCRVHGMENLFIAGASVFPTVGCANPVLTTVALSLRLAAHLKDNPT